MFSLERVRKCKVAVSGHEKQQRLHRNREMTKESANYAKQSVIAR